MEKRDVAFLNDYQNFGYLGHMASAVALCRASEQAEDVASKVHSLIDSVAPINRLTPDEAVQRARKEGTANRVLGAAIAKLFAEYLSTIEDFGALLYAISARKDGGIFYQYAQSRGQVDDIFKSILAQSELDLLKTLKLPCLEALEGNLSSEELESLAHDYDMIAEAVLDVAEMYRESIKGIDERDSVHPETMPNWKDYLWIVLDYKPEGKWSELEEQAKEHKTLVGVFNKIKHRFLVIEKIPALLEAIDDRGYLMYGHQSKDPKFAEAFLNSIAEVVTRQLALSSILVRLHGAGAI